MELMPAILVILLCAVQYSTQDVQRGNCIDYYRRDCDEFCWRKKYKGGYCTDDDKCMCRSDFNEGPCKSNNEYYWYRHFCNYNCKVLRFNGGHCDASDDCICRRDFKVGSCNFSLIDLLTGNYFKGCKGFCLSIHFTDGYCDISDRNQCYCRNI